MIELLPTMEEEAHVGGGSRGFLVDLTSNITQKKKKRLEKLKEEKNVAKKRRVCERENNVILYTNLSHSFYIADIICFKYIYFLSAIIKSHLKHVLIINMK
jgi:hypothetical protein